MSALLQFLIVQNKLFNELIQSLSNNVHNTSCPSQEVTLILGNEACDIDSMVSSLLWSYHMQSQTKHSSVLYIPVFTIPKKELKLRKDALYLFQQIDKSFTDHLFFQDTIAQMLSYHSTKQDEEKQAQQTPPFKLNVHLMDHNALSVSLDPLLAPYVNYIIDHHKDEGKYLARCNPQNMNRIIGVAGSNVSLIINHILSIHKDYDVSTLGDLFGALINAVILLDTGGFDENMGKTTDTDLKTYKLFEKYNLNDDHTAWYKMLLDLRSNVDGFDVSDLLIRDMKIFKENEIIFGIPGIGIALENVMETEGDHLFEAIHSFQVEKKLDLVPVMTIFSHKVDNKKEIQRQLALFSTNEMLFDHVSNDLQQVQSMQMKAYQPKSKHVLKTNQAMYYQWWKMDISICRKKLVPLLRTVLSKL
eukprot:549453_1